jgi:hypothetical protein
LKKLIPIAMVLLLGSYASAGRRTITSTGFFADQGCVKGRAAHGDFTPNNTECAKQCLAKGSPLVFLDERAKALYTVKGYSDPMGDMGYHLEVTGTLDEDSKILTIDSVKRLEYMPASCSRSPHKK